MTVKDLRIASNTICAPSGGTAIKCPFSLTRKTVTNSIKKPTFVPYMNHNSNEKIKVSTKEKNETQNLCVSFFINYMLFHLYFYPNDNRHIKLPLNPA